MKRYGKKIRTAAFLLIALLCLSVAAGFTVSAAEAPELTGEEIALRIGDSEFTAAEMNYLLGTLFMETVQGYAFTAEGQEMYLNAVPSASGEMISFKDALLQAAEGKLTMGIYLKEQAEKLQLSLDKDDQLALQMFLDSIREDAKDSGMSEKELLEAMYGKGASEESVSAMLKRDQLNAKALKTLLESYKISDEDLDKELQDHAELYELVSYRAYTFNDEELQNPESASLLSEEEKEAGNQALLARAEALRRRINDENSFLAETFAELSPEEQSAVGITDFTLNINQAKADLPGHFGDWLFHPERQTGEITVVSASGSASVLYFLSRALDATPVFSSRHILFRERTDEDNLSALDRARAVLKEYESGKPSEDRFAALAREHSEDLSTAPRGGYMEQVIPGTLLRAYEDWCLDPARSKGDTGLIEVEGSGVYLVYFISTGSESYRVKADQSLRSLRFLEEMNLAMKGAAAEYIPEGMEYVLPLP